MSNIILWQPESGDLIPASARTASEISQYAAQLSVRDKNQIVSAIDAGHYEMAINYLWGKTITALKKELSTVGISLLGEMLGRADVDDDEDVDAILTTREAIHLAGELGVVSTTDALRLRHTYELISHFSSMDGDNGDSDVIDESEAISSLRACIKGVLGRPKVEVARKFVEFRTALEGRSLTDTDPMVDMLKSSPYFFRKLTINVLMSAVKKNTGANLEHALANINVLISAIWPQLREAEKWQVGHAYAEAFADGKITVVSGLKSALLKVKGFDFVPENLRSDTFVKAAEAIIWAHEGSNNFYNEPIHVKTFSKLGTAIPIPALPICITALLCVFLGNKWSTSWAAAAEAEEMLIKLSFDRWNYYINNVFPGDIKILQKLMLDKPCSNWLNLSERCRFGELMTKNRNVGLLIKASINREADKVSRCAKKIEDEYYGRS